MFLGVGRPRPVAQDSTQLARFSRQGLRRHSPHRIMEVSPNLHAYHVHRGYSRRNFCFDQTAEVPQQKNDRKTCEDVAGGPSGE